VRIAYAVHGNGPPLILGKNWISHLQYDWDDPVLGHLLDALGRVVTVVRYDERGTGCPTGSRRTSRWRRD
jgi:hypothetical protein